MSLSRLVLAITLFLFLSCEKQYDPLFKNGVIWGHASTYKNIDDTGTIRVVAKGPYGSKSVDFHHYERFRIDSLANGTYTLDFMKEGYGTVRLYGIQVFGNDTVYGGSVNLFNKYEDYEIPSFLKAYPAIRERSFPLQTYICIEISETVFLEYWELPILLFMSDKKEISCTNFQYFYPAWDAGSNDAHVNVIYVPPASLPFEKGTQVFVKGYVCDPDEYIDGILDTYLGTPQFSSLDKERNSNVVSFTMP